MTKARGDGTIRLRLIVDMRRAQLNDNEVLEERIVAPRLSVLVLGYYVPDVSAPGRQLRCGDGCGRLRRRVPQSGCPCVGFDGEYFVMRSVAFGGGAASLLVWGRAAAFLGRSGQSLFTPTGVRLELFVDDPWIGLMGTLFPRTCQHP